MAVKEIEVIEIDDFSPSPKPKGTTSTIRSVFCLKNRDEIQKYEEEEDCFILDFDPNEKKKPSCKDVINDDVDLHVVAEKGQVACRDYPHSRHTCAKYSFKETSHDRHCQLCYCYVCDVTAPCSKWTGPAGHCHAFDNETWKTKREKHREKKSRQLSIVDLWFSKYGKDILRLSYQTSMGIKRK